MFKHSFIATLVAMSVYCTSAADFKSPEAMKRRDSTALYQSPLQIQSDVVNFRKELIESLDENDIGKFKEKLNRFFKAMPYDMYIKSQAKNQEQKQVENQSFYAAIFYWVLRELSGVHPALRSTGSSVEIMRLFLKNAHENYFALEIFIAPKAINIEKLNRRNSFSYMCVDHNKNRLHKFTTIRIIIDFSKGTDERPCLQVYNFKPETKNHRIIDPHNVCFLNVNADRNSALESPVHKIIRVLDKDFVDEETALGIVQKNLELFYNGVPRKFRDHFKEGGHEKYYQALFFWICQFLRAGYAETECRANNGRIDVLLHSIIRKKVLRYIIVEFKHRDRDAKKAWKQILDREYYNMVNLSTQVQPILLLGINIISSGDQIEVSKIVSSVHDPKTIISPLKVMSSSPGYNFKTTDDQEDEDTSMLLPARALDFSDVD